MRKVAYKCVTCRVKFAKPTTQMMAQLPFFRLPSSRLHLFDHSAIDVAGPFVIHFEKQTYKVWMLVICCCTVGAVHWEMMNSIRTSSFLMSAERFIAVQPRPTVFLADNGTNFRGAETRLNRKAKDQIDISEAQRKLSIEFRFAPPRVPHFMGLVERIVG
jgi:transposase InsO family protein